MAHIFVSYHHDDARFAELLDTQLEEAGFTVWRDPDLRAGENWRDAIDDAIRTASSLIVVMSPAANGSPYVNYEWSFAIGAGVHVVPLLLGLRQEQLHPRLATLQARDFADPLKRRWDQLFVDLKQQGSSAPPAVRRSGRAPAVVDEAARALNSLVPEERSHAIDALRLSKHSSALDVLAGGVQHELADVRRLCALALAERHDPRCVPALIEALRSDISSDERRKCWVAIRTAGPAAGPELLRFLNSEDVEDRRYAASMLPETGDDTAIAGLTRALQRESDDSARVEMIGALARLGRAPAAVLLPYVGDSSSAVRRAVAEALPSVPEPVPVPSFLPLLTDADRDVRAAAIGIGAFRDRSAVPVLTDRLKNDPDYYVRSQAAAALGDIGDLQAVPALIAATNDKEGMVRDHARQALGTIGGSDIASRLVDIVIDPRHRSQIGAANLLAAFADPTVVPRLVDALNNTDERVRAAAATALGMKGNSAAVPVLLARLEDEDETVRRAAVDALARIGDPAAVPGLVRVLQDSDAGVRERAATCLRAFDTAEARRAIRHL